MKLLVSLSRLLHTSAGGETQMLMVGRYLIDSWCRGHAEISGPGKGEEHVVVDYRSER